MAFLTPLMHALLGRHRVGALLCSLLLLEVGLVLKRLLLVGCHAVGLRRGLVAGHGLGHRLGHSWRCGVLLFRRVNGGFTVNAIAVGRLGCVQAGLGRVSDDWCEDGVSKPAYLNEVLAFRLSDERLKLGCREGVN